MKKSNLKKDNGFKPYVPREKDLKKIEDWHKSFLIDDELKSKMKERISELKRGEYYDAMKVARKIGYESPRAGIILGILVALGHVKRTEFFHLKETIIHKSDLPFFVATLKRYMELKQNWLEAIKVAKSALQKS